MNSALWGVSELVFLMVVLNESKSFIFKYRGIKVRSCLYVFPFAPGAFVRIILAASVNSKLAIALYVLLVGSINFSSARCNVECHNGVEI